MMGVYENEYCVDLLDYAISGIQKSSQQVGAFDSLFPGLTRTVACLLYTSDAADE